MRILMAVLLLTLCVGHSNASAAEARFTLEHLKANSDVDEAAEPAKSYAAAIARECETKDQGPGVRVAPIVGAVLGVFVDWMFDRAMSRLSDRFKRKLAEYSKVYSNEPAHLDMFAKEYWSEPDSQGYSCVVFQRLECADEDCKPTDTGLSIAFKIKREPSNLRILPIALQLSRPAAKHSGGNYTFAAQVSLHSPQVDEQSGGAMWASPQIDLASHGCKVNKNKTLVDKVACFKDFEIKKADWAGAQVLPLPPLTVQAFVVSIAEVGNPPRGLKGLSEFLDSSQEGLSDVLSAALKKKLKLEEEG